MAAIKTVLVTILTQHIVEWISLLPHAVCSGNDLEYSAPKKNGSALQWKSNVSA